MMRLGRLVWRPLLACLAAVMLSTLVAPPTHAGEPVAVDPLPFKDRAQEVRFQHLTKQLRCLVCQDESLYASQSDLARQMRHLVFQQMQKGWSDQRIKQYLVARYSDYVLYKPPVRPFTWLLWFGPGVILLIGAGVVTVTVRARRGDAPETVPEPDADDW